MKKAILAGSALVLTLGSANIAFAQEGDEGTDVEATEEASDGAIVTREEITEQVVDENGDPVPVLDENDEPVLDDDGNPVFETTVVGFTQTVETPSGISHTVTKVDGSPAVVTHENLGAPEAAAAARESASAAASNARETAEAARQNANGAHDAAQAAQDAAQAAQDAAQSARDAAQNARDNARNIPRPGGPG